MKEEHGVDRDFWYDDIALKESAKGERGRLEALVKQYEEELEMLEAWRSKHLKKIRELPISITDKGLKFVGLDAIQIDRVSEYVKNLKEGKDEYPLDDRSIELKKELKEVRWAHDQDKKKIEKLEQEIILNEYQVVEVDGEDGEKR